MRNKVNKGMRIVMVIMLALITPCMVFARMSSANEQSTSNNSTTMMSVNNSELMQTGSSYSSDVYEVGSSSPSSAPAAAPGGPRKTLPDPDPSGYNPENPQEGPIGDAVLPLMLMAAACGGVVYLRRQREARV